MTEGYILSCRVVSHHEDSSIVRWGWRQVDSMAMQIITDNSDKGRWPNKGYKYIPILLLELRLVVVYSFSRLLSQWWSLGYMYLVH